VFSYHHWDEHEEDNENWSWYYVSMYDIITSKRIEEDWPVFAKDFDSAMTIYELLYKQAITQ
jgi:hypothetical protein